jgi:hypothetical protein
VPEIAGSRQAALKERIGGHFLKSSGTLKILKHDRSPVSANVPLAWFCGSGRVRFTVVDGDGNSGEFYSK